MLDMVAVGERHGIRFPRDFALLFKQMLYFDRFMRVLAPYTDIHADQRLQMVQSIDPNLLLKALIIHIGRIKPSVCIFSKPPIFCFMSSVWL